MGDSGGFAVAGVFAAFLVAVSVVYLAVLVVTIIAYVKIVQKSGYPGWYVLLGFVPLVGILLFAFKEWPIQRELAYLRAQVYGRGGPPAGYPPVAPPQSEQAAD